MSKKPIILGIESSCDETGVSIISENKEGEPKILSNIVSSLNKSPVISTPHIIQININHFILQITWEQGPKNHSKYRYLVAYKGIFDLI